MDKKKAGYREATCYKTYLKNYFTNSAFFK